MRHFSPDFNELTGGSSSHVPSGMDNDPNADEEVIDQQQDSLSPREEYPKAIDESPSLDEANADQAEPAKIVPDDLAASIAYALDGSGPGPTNDKPNVAGHSVIAEGMTGGGSEDDEDVS
ncbi:hypothetical protein [Spirosoma flavum]|uniref:Uncharacterized protein n=1 Tax=Spirosoma flavum TaxID=2048557 RepID=A0ABW6AQD0_9BACT